MTATRPSTAGHGSYTPWPSDAGPAKAADRPPPTAPRSRRRTIRGRLVAGFGAALLALLASGLLGIYTVSAVHRDLRDGMVQATEVGGQLARSDDATLRFVALAQARLLGGANSSAARIDSLAGTADSLRRALLSGTMLTTGDRREIEQVGALQGRIEVRLAVAQAFIDIGKGDDAAREAALATASLDTLVAHAARVSQSLDARATRALSDANLAVRRQRMSMGAIFAAGLFAALTFGILTWRAVTLPLGRLIAGANALGRGDLRAIPDPSGLDEEYRALTLAFAQMATGLRAVLRELDQGASEVAATAEELAAGAEETNAASEQVAGAAASIATAAAMQTTSLETIAAAAGRSAERAVQVASFAEDAEGAAERVTRSAAAGAAAAGQALEKMAAVGSMTEEAAPAVEALTQKVMRIGAIADSIGAIARQTNLLALNAAIEAARAGEHGRGFAIVAGEVKKLANETERALDGIHKLTRDIGAAAERTAERFTAVREGVASTQSVVKASSSELARIAQEISESRVVVASIAEAARAQRGDVAALTRELDAVLASAEENASTSEEVSAVVEEQSASVAHVTESSQHLATVAARLKSGMSRFGL